MALSVEAEIRTAFEIANVIYADSARIHNGFGLVFELTDMNLLKDALRTYLTVTLDSDSTVKVQALLTEWDAVRLDTLIIDNGSVGNVTGLSLDADRDRQRIKELFQVYVPVMDLAQSVLRQVKATQAPTGILPIRLG